MRTFGQRFKAASTQYAPLLFFVLAVSFIAVTAYSLGDTDKETSPVSETFTPNSDTFLYPHILKNCGQSHEDCEGWDAKLVMTLPISLISHPLFRP